MSHNPSDMYYPAQMPTGQVQAPQSMPSSGIQGYHSHQHQTILQQPYGPPPPTYSHFNGYSNGLPSPQHNGHLVSGQVCHPAHVLPHPQTMPVIHANMSPPSFLSQPAFDMTGQIAPPGMKPRVTATLWEDEGSLCFQVEAKGVCVARREDNQMINGTKLLNVAGMTRGRRDGILKSEKLRHVVKIGPMHLKGVWIPFERALDFANKEKITELLYPLFVYDIGSLLYHPTNQTRTNAVMAAAERRKQEQNTNRNTQSLALPSLNQHHHHSVNPSGPNQLHCQSNIIATQPPTNRSTTERASNFPTPPTSASSVIGGPGHSEGNFQWGSQTNVGNLASNSLAIDTGLSNSRTMPNTPASTPPGTSGQGVQYSQSNSSFDAPRHAYQPQPVSEHPNASHHSQCNSYLKNNMGPPKPRPHVSPKVENQDSKVSDGSSSHAQNQPLHSNHDDNREIEQDTEYTNGANPTFDSNRGYNYNSVVSIGSISNEHPHSPSELHGPSSHHSPGHATPRTTTSQQTYYPQSAGYSTSPRAQPQTSNLLTGVGGERVSLTSDGNNDIYPQSDNIPVTNGYSNQSQSLSRQPVNGNKRVRDEDDEQSPSIRENSSESDGNKRRKLATALGPSYDTQALNRGRVQTTQRRR